MKFENKAFENGLHTGLPPRKPRYMGLHLVYKVDGEQAIPYANSSYVYQYVVLIHIVYYINT